MSFKSVIQVEKNKNPNATKFYIRFENQKVRKHRTRYFTRYINGDCLANVTISWPFVESESNYIQIQIESSDSDSIPKDISKLIYQILY